MPTASLAPLDETITIAELTRDPYPIYRRLRREAPVLRVKSVGRTFLTKAADTKYVKDNAALFSSDDPNTPMKRAFLAHQRMREEGALHRCVRIVGREQRRVVLHVFGIGRLVGERPAHGLDRRTGASRRRRW